LIWLDDMAAAVRLLGAVGGVTAQAEVVKVMSDPLLVPPLLFPTAR
jgi:hypothetical protein